MSFAVLYCSVNEMFPEKWTLKVRPMRTWVLKWNKQHLGLLENNCLYSFNCHMVAYKGLKWGKKERKRKKEDSLVIESPNLRKNSPPEHQKRMFLKWEQRREISGWMSECVRKYEEGQTFVEPWVSYFLIFILEVTSRCFCSFSSHKDSVKQE